MTTTAASQSDGAPPITHALIEPGTGTATLSQPVAVFRSFFDARIQREHVLDLIGLYNHVIALPVRHYRKKGYAPCFSLAEYQVAPFIGKTADKYGRGPGKQRSNSHVVKMGPGIAFDVDSVPAHEMSDRMRALGLGHIVFTSYSSGLTMPAENKVAGRGRLILFLDGTWEPHEHERVCETINRLVLNGVADDGAFAAPQPFAVHCTAAETPGQPTFHYAQYGLRLSLAKIRALSQEPSPKPSSGGEASKTDASSDAALAIEEAREIGAMGCISQEKGWLWATNCTRRSWPHKTNPTEISAPALDVADAMSAADPVPGNYVNRDDVEAKMKRCDGEKHRDKFDAVQGWARKCAIVIIKRAHTLPLNIGPLSAVFFNKAMPATRLDMGLDHQAEVPSTISTTPANVRRATLYLARWHRPEVIDDLVQRFPALSAHAAEIEQRKAERAAVAKTLGHNALETAMTAFNNDYAIVNTSGQPKVVRKFFDVITGYWQFEFSTFEDFKKLNIKETVDIEVDGKTETLAVAPLWLKWKQGCIYRNGIKLLPPVAGNKPLDDPHVLNRWCGFGVEPKTGKCNLLLMHLLCVVCRGDGSLFQYLARWMARVVQSPGEAGQVAIVLIGPEGSGKGVVGRTMVKLMGQHGIHVTSKQHLVGRFNGHLQDAITIFADESFFAHDREALSILKSMITEPELLMEAKYRNPERMPNYRHLIVATNETLAAELSGGDRRYAPFNVDFDASIKDPEFRRALAELNIADARGWFAAVYRELESGGYEAFLHRLLQIDLAGFNVWDIPQSTFRSEQVALSRRGIDAWYYDGLCAGGLCFDAEGTRLDWDPAPSNALLYKSYLQSAKSERHPPSEHAFGVALSKLGVPPSIKAGGNKVIGYSPQLNRPINGNRAWCRPMGSLDDARKAYAAKFKIRVDWP